MLLLNSIKKSRIMKKIEKQMRSPHQFNASDLFGGKKSKERELFDELFQVMIRMNGPKQVILKYNVTADELYRISKNLSCAVDYYKGRYLPVALVSFAEPLECLLENKETVMKYLGGEKLLQVVGLAMQKL